MSTDRQPSAIDPEFMGHDQDLADAVESLKRETGLTTASSGGTGATASTEAASPSGTEAAGDQGPTRCTPPRGSRPVLRLPSGFLTQMLPLDWVLPGGRGKRGIPYWAAALIIVLVSVCGAWAMVYWLRPERFGVSDERNSSVAPDTTAVPHGVAVRARVPSAGPGRGSAPVSSTVSPESGAVRKARPWARGARPSVFNSSAESRSGADGKPPASAPSSSSSSRALGPLIAPPED
jgi:hypothetical protein